MGLVHTNFSTKSKAEGLLMALPTAQLGGFPNINVPSFVPVVETSKRPKLWEQVLAQVLSQAAGSALAQGAQNVMTKDSAAEFGETPNAWYKRAFVGPNVGPQEAAQRRGIKAEDLRQTKSDAAALDRLVKQISAQADQFSASVDRDIAMTGIKAADTESERLSRQQELAQQIKAQRLLEEIRGIRQTQESEKDRTAQAGVRASQEKENLARARQYESDTEDRRWFRDQMKEKQSAKPTPNTQPAPSYPLIPKGGVEVQPDVRERINARMGANSPFADRTNPQVLAQEQGALNQRYQQGRQEAAMGATEDETQRLFQELVVARVKDKMYNSSQTRAAVDSILTRLDELGRFPTN